MQRYIFLGMREGKNASEGTNTVFEKFFTAKFEKIFEKNAIFDNVIV